MGYTQQSGTQNMNPPYHQIPEYPAHYESGAILARMIDGLGYRYYWATKDLRPEDLAYQPTPEARNTQSTLNHLYGLALTIRNTLKQEPNIRPLPQEELTFEALRSKTLLTIKEASDLASVIPTQDLEKHTIIFERNGKRNETPFWHLINGPLADAIYHVGQVVSFRRTSGNPMHAGVNVFMGKTKEE